MNNFSEKRALVEAALIAALTAVFTISVMYLPILSLLLIFIPVPFIILSVRHNTKYALLSFIVASLLIGMLTEILYTTSLLILLGPMTIAMGYCIHHKKEPFTTIGIGAIASIVSAFLMIKLASIVLDINIIDEMALIMETVMNQQMEMLKGLDINRFNAQEMVNYFMMIFPGIIILQSFLGAFINYYFVIVMMRRFKMTEEELPEFSDFRLPKNIVLGSFIMFLLSYLTTFIQGIYHTTLITNITLIFIFLFFLQGLALISYLLKKARFGKGTRVFLLILIFLISPLITLVSLIGLIDSVMNIRKLG